MKKKKLKILYEDKYIIVVYKPSGLYTVATEKEKQKTLYHEVLNYLHTKNQKVFIVHRLDKETSGLVLFAKSIEVKNKLQNNWEKVTRKYYAKVLGCVNKNGEIKSYLYEDKNYYTHISKNKKGLFAWTSFDVLKSNEKYSLLDIEIHTGRKNQIRVQLNEIGFPILGDKKYGNNKYNRLMLEAYYLEFVHPINNERIKVTLPLNPLFDLI